MLIELARVLNARPHEFTYEFVWLDGEEAFCQGWDECGRPGSPDNTYGSRYYVQAARKAGALASIKAMILLDMVGARDLRIERETGYSAPWLNDIIWAQAARLGYSDTFVNDPDQRRRRPCGVCRGRHPLGRPHRFERLPAVAHASGRPEPRLGAQSADRRRRRRRIRAGNRKALDAVGRGAQGSRNELTPVSVIEKLARDSAFIQPWDLRALPGFPPPSGRPQRPWLWRRSGRRARR